jgi:hypothetical protein
MTGRCFRCHYPIDPQRVREAAFRALRPRFEAGPDPGYFSTDRRGLIPIRIVVQGGRMQARAWRERTRADFFAVN